MYRADDNAMPSKLARVVLSWPTHLASTDEASTAPESWIQIAKTGAFVSPKYGKFSITTKDLGEMMANFANITPKAPTQLPVDYDHLSMDPQRPGDGAAAGWIKQLELRQDGNELWGLVSWTPDAATRIQKKEYQFVSPSFVKEHVHKDGQQIGTTLLAAAITNHPFLEGMAAVTLSAGLADMAYQLCDDPKMLATPAPDDKPADGAPAEGTPAEEAAETPAVEATEDAAPGVTGKMEAGQKVSVKDDEVQKPEQLGVVFTIAQVVGEGADAFVSLLAPDGTIAEWFRADELKPAKAADAPADPTPVPPEQKDASQTPEPAKLSDTPPAEEIAPVVETTPEVVHARESHMKTFELTDVNGNKVTVGEEAVAALDLSVKPTAEVDALKGQIVSLTAQVQTLADAGAAAEQRARTMELTAELDRLSKNAFISKPERDWAEKTFANQVDLSAFKEWAKTKTTPIIKLNTEHGSGLGSDPSPEESSTKLISLARKLEKDRRIPYRDALILASKMDPDASSDYRLGFYPQTVQ